MGHPASILAVLTPTERKDFLPDAAWAGLEALAPVLRTVDPSGMSAADLQRELANSEPEVLVACWKTPPLPAELPPRLRYVCYLAGSVKKLVTRQHIERGLIVTNWGGSVSAVVAECALMLVLTSLRRAGYWFTAMHRDSAWKNGTTETASLFGKRVGIHGFGQIARELTKLLKPFGVPISVYAPESDPALYAAHGAQRVGTLEQLFSENEVVVELAPLIPATLGIVTESLLRRIPTGGVFVNVGRGAVVDEEGLLRVALEGKIHFALDVYGVEPLPADSGLRGLPNVILLPHLGGPTLDRRRDAGAFGLRNLRAYAEGRPLDSVVTPEVFDHTT